MGGAQALHLAARATSLFGTVAALSAPGDVPNGDTLLDAWRRRPASASRVRLSLLCGADDPFLTESKQALSALKTLGITAEWTETPGSHDWSTWRDHLARVLRLR